MTEWLAEWGPWGLALASFLAGTVLGAPSEAVLGLLVWKGLDPVGAVVLATSANVLGTATLFGMARAGAKVVERNVDPVRLARVQGWFRRFGVWSLLLSFVPFVGDLFVVAAGMAKVPWLLALFMSGLGKGARYAVVAALAR